MSAGLFPEADAYTGDPLYPDTDVVTPGSVVASLTRPDRLLRIHQLVDQAHAIYDEGVATHGRGREVVASCVLFSGGNDSTVVAHMFRDRATHAIHANTTIGIEQTRQYVRDTCKTWRLLLLEKVAPVTYRDLVLEYGFPGPAMHFKMYARLKERPLDAARRELGIARARDKCAVFIAGIRRAESRRRTDREMHQSDGTVIWVSPLSMWTKPDLNTYRLMHGDVPSNPVADTLHMSGECLCGAFAHRGELDEIGYWYPEMRAEIEALEADVRAAGHLPPYDTWGHGQGAPSPTGRLCQSCDDRYIEGQLTFEDGAA